MFSFENLYMYPAGYSDVAVEEVLQSKTIIQETVTVEQSETEYRASTLPVYHAAGEKDPNGRIRLEKAVHTISGPCLQKYQERIPVNEDSNARDHMTEDAGIFTQP